MTGIGGPRPICPGPVPESCPPPAVAAHRWDRMLAAALVLATVAVYLPVRHADFVALDDSVYVCDNFQVCQGLSWEGVRWALTTFEAANWQPLTWLSLMLDVSLYGLNPGAFHTTNLFLHLANSVLLLVLFQRTTGRLWPAAAVAALFALHPLHVESVAWISERKDVLSTFFGLLAMLAYHRYTLAPALGRYLVVTIFFLFALAAKPMLVTLPMVLLLIDYWPLGRLGAAPSVGKSVRLVVEKVPLLALTAASCIVTYQAQLASGAVKNFERFPLDLRLANALVSYLSYLGKIFWPSGLSAFYPLPVRIAAGKATAAGLVLVVISLAALQGSRRHPYAAVGWLWFLGTLVPVIGLVQVGGQAMADRYTYFSAIGIFVLIAYGAEARCRRPKARTFLAALSLLALVGLSLVTARQVHFWQGSLSLYQRMIDTTQGRSATAYNVLGTALDRQGRYAEAEQAFGKALALRPDFLVAHFNLANLMAAQDRVAEAQRHYEQALAIDPNDALTHNNMARMLLKNGQINPALSHFRRAVALSSNAPDLESNLGAALLAAGNVNEALIHLQHAAKASPHILFQRNLGVGLMAAGRWREAEGCFLKVLSVNPRHAQTVQDLERVRRALAAGLNPS